MRPGRAVDHSPPSSAAFMEEYSYNSTHPLAHTEPVTGKFYLFTCGNMSMYNVVYTVTNPWALRLRNRGSIPSRNKSFSPFRVSRAAVGLP